jgi:diguanylate cyclase (GGDEF)-like protein
VTPGSGPAAGGVADEALTSVARWTAETLRLSGCRLYEYRPEDESTVALAQWAREPAPADASWLGSSFPLAEQPAFRRVLREQRAVADHIDDADLPPADRDRMARCETKSCLLVPLVAQGEVIGCLELAERRRVHHFTADELALADTLAALSAAAIGNARLQRASDDRNRRLASLLSASRAVSSTLVVEDVLARVARTAAETLQADVCYIYEYLHDDDAIAWQAMFERAHGPQAQELGTVFPLTDFPEDREILQNGVIIEENLSDAELPPSARASMLEWGQQTLLSVPLLIEDRAVGLLEIAQLDRERRFAAEEIEFVRALGEHAAIAINNARQYRATERRNERLVHLVDLSQSLTASLDTGQIVERLEAGLRRLFPERTCSTTVRLSESGRRQSGLKGLAREAVRQRRPAQAPSRSPGHAVVPLSSGQRLLGTVEVQSEPARAFAEDELEVLQLVGNQAAAALENARLYGRVELSAITDGLTGLYNHRHFYECLGREMKRALRYELPLSLLMIDIDDFKYFNDRLGHPAGDALLRVLAGMLTTETRQQVDVVARYGGEEFAIILPSTSAAGAVAAGRRLRDRIAVAQAAEAAAPAEGGATDAREDAPPDEAAGDRPGGVPQAKVVGERIRQAIERREFGKDEPPRTVTVSIGVAGVPDHAASVDQLVAAADAALYRSKALGKNRVEVAPAPEPSPARDQAAG